jgi:Putative beta-barrel porin-2, OmpL-like. bbp2
VADATVPLLVRSRGAVLVIVVKGRKRAAWMRQTFRSRVLVFILTMSALLAIAAEPTLSQSDPGPHTSPELATRVQELEKEVGQLKSLLAASKTDSTATAAAGAASVPAAAVASATPAAAPAAPSLAGLLGPTTISGFVDVYYGYNSNQPASHTTALRNFDINSGQFGLNMIELIADKPPDAAASRVGYQLRWVSGRP